ncbi:MAG: tetratricopeptide repeat protein, partial [Bacteroidetes bacterium]|nr:tetratricopeptide repeat protein [Bacteroidota bacterium]
LYRYDKALENFGQALDIMHDLDNKPAITGILNNIGEIYFEKGDFEKALNYFKQSLDLNEELGNSKDVAASLNNIGVAYHSSGDYNEAIKSYEKSIDLSEQLGNKKEVSISLNNIGNVNYDWSKFNQALEYYHKSLKIKEEIDYKKGIAMTYHNIANVHRALKEYEQAIEYYNQSIVLAKELKLRDLLQKNYEAISQVYFTMKDCQNAYDYYKLFTEAGFLTPVHGRSAQLSELQGTYTREDHKTQMIADLKGEIEKQKLLSRFHTQSKQLEIELKDRELQEKETKAKNQRMVIYGLAGGFLFFLVLLLLILKENRQKKRAFTLLEHQKDEIQRQAEQLIIVNKELNKLSIVARETDNAVIIARPDGEIEWVNEGFTKLTGYSLAEFKEVVGSNIINTSTNPEIKRHLHECIQGKKSVEYLSHATTKDGQQIWLQTTITPALDEKGALLELVAIDSNITGIKNAEEEIKQQQKELVKAFKQSSKQQIALHKAMIQIEEQKNEITDSIQYASRIQTAIFPPADYFSEVLPDHFVLNLPRDIVTGDFYWCSKIGNQILVAAADCTGHGVPGAFMSLLGVTFMNEIASNYIKLKKTDLKANEILNDLRDFVIRSLRQTGEIGGSKDGMDISLCVIDDSLTKLQFAGANNSMFLIRKPKTADVPSHLEVIKADKMPIGIHARATVSFTNHKIFLKKGDTFYLFSDGFVDQFGGPEGKKLKTKYFKQMLVKIQDRTMNEQKEHLIKELQQWQGEQEQIDDILIMGIRRSEEHTR